MANLIFSRSASNLPLTTEEILHRAPSVYTTTHSMSPRYGQVTTANAIGILADFGFYPVQAAQKGQGRHKAHLLAFADTTPTADAGRGELILYNSHDGSSSLKLFAGYFQFICSNGIVAGDGFESRLRHTSGTVNGFENLVTTTAGRMPDLFGRIEDMKSRTINKHDAHDLAREGAAFRWDASRVTDNTVGDLLDARRMGDNEQNLWGVFNRVQEGLIRGGVRVGENDRRARAISSISVSVAVNQSLWDLVAA